MEIDVVSIEQGRAILKMQVRPDMMNGAGRLQGGILAVVADEAMALALCPLPAETEGIAPISESTSFIRWVLEVVILVEGHVIRKGKKVAFAESEVFMDSDERTLLSRTSAAFAVTTDKN